MERFEFLISSEQLKFLKGLPGTVAEHIRRAVDEYIQKVRGISASTSASKEVE